MMGLWRDRKKYRKKEKKILFLSHLTVREKQGDGKSEFLAQMMRPTSLPSIYVTVSSPNFPRPTGPIKHGASPRSKPGLVSYIRCSRPMARVGVRWRRPSA